jgi:TRAP-type mannitol/chloroaromatic compound transport system permease small subunit
VIYVIDKINEWVGMICAILLGVLACIAFYGVLTRYLFNAPSLYAWDVNIQLFAFVLMLSGGYTLLKENHVSVDIIPNMLSLKKRKLLEMFNMLFCFVSSIALIWYGSILAWEAFIMGERMSTSMWNPLFWPVKIMVPLGGALLLIQALAQFAKDYKELKGVPYDPRSRKSKEAV